MAQQIFNRSIKRIQRNRVPYFPHQCDYLKQEIAERMKDRFLDITREFKSHLDVGAGKGYIMALNSVNSANANKGSNDTAGADIAGAPISGKLCCVEMSDIVQMSSTTAREKNVEILQKDESALEGIPDNSFECVTSMSLHWINDLPHLLSRINSVLVPDGCFMGAMVGGDSLFELRGSLQLAEQDLYGGVGLHISPMIRVADAGRLLQSSGFNLITVDMEEIVVNYPSMFHLMHDLQAMGESNCLNAMQGTPRDVFMAANAIYKSVYGNKDGSIPATFQVIFVIGWKKDPLQPKPLERGSGKTSLKSHLEGCDPKK